MAQVAIAEQTSSLEGQPDLGKMMHSQSAPTLNIRSRPSSGASATKPTLARSNSGTSATLKAAGAGLTGVKESDNKPQSSYERMKEKNLFRDYTSQIYPAGKSTMIYLDTAERDVQPDIYFPAPPTPTNERKFRKNLTAGDVCVHFGLKGQKLPDQTFRYGVRSSKGETTKQAFEAGQKFGIAAYRHERGEAVYESTKKEPLGKTYDRGHNVPLPEKGFGVPSAEAEDGKEVIFPRGVKPEEEYIRQRYVKTHGNFAPGEMFTREYNWPEESRGEHFRFGVKQTSGNDQGGEGAKMALSPNLEDDGSYPKTRFIQRTSEDYRSVVHPKLARTRNYQQGQLPVKPGHTFGIKSMSSEVTARSCILGYYSLNEQLPDQDLGRCIKPGRRNVTSEMRAFGTPSVRADIPALPVEKRSLADCQNYGDEVGAPALLNPQRFDSQGVADREYLLRRPKEEIQSLLQNSGYRFSNEDFDEIWNTAVNLFEDSIPKASLDSFMFVYSDWINEHVKTSLKAL
eukprot:gnl/MRDRNA2_/MRDRNA2_90329_c0_seq1.p1 gnl/MRDRNA2_/MRDRNA2_90329_c0~~gnl/MRDRNA2_/MRDRNA2_90329_c0_seq1.p1  ORF type:complete len:513 (+),score=78.21 gnl/MRDRNA2_/MRDRNA2_90329_c0_seq1:64-1602(+)